MTTSLPPALLLLTGPKGSGKTCLAGALCRAVSKAPTLAFTFTVDCKPLRGLID